MVCSRATLGRFFRCKVQFCSAAQLGLLLGAAGLSQGQSLQPNDQPRTVHGVVVNSVTHAPIARALVRSADDRFAALTDGSGQFEFTPPKREQETSANVGGVIYSAIGAARPYGGGDRIWFTATKPGFFEDRNGSRAVPSADGEITISLVPEGFIKGRITLSTGDAASGLNVQLYLHTVVEGWWRWMPGTMTQVNSAGEFRFAELQAGSYKLVTHELLDNDPLTTPPGGQLYGFPPVYFPGASDLASATVIELSAGQTVEANFALTRQPYYPIRIPVANGDAGGGMNVTVEGQRGPGYSLGYNATEGRITGLLPNGNYDVQGTIYGLKTQSGQVNLTVNGGPAEGPAMTLVPGSSISFEVKEEFNETQPNNTMTWNDGKHQYALHGARADLQPELVNAEDFERPRGGSLRPPQGPDDNALVIENVLPGKYRVRLFPTRGYVASATMGTTDVLHEPITIGAGTNTQVEVKVRDDFAEIDGTVMSSNGETLANGHNEEATAAWIYFVPLPDSSGQFQQIGVTGDGKFNYSMLAPGSYRILAFAKEQPNLPYRDPASMKAYESKGQAITLAPGQKATIQLQMTATE